MVDWNEVASILDRIAGTSDDTLLDHGQKASVTELACRIRAGQRSALLADEVGMGKTRCGFRAEAGRHSDQLPATVPI